MNAALADARQDLLHWATVARESRIDKKPSEFAAAQSACRAVLDRLRALYRLHPHEFNLAIFRDIEVCKVCASLESPARRPHCFGCKAELHSRQNAKCPKCHW